MKKPHDLTVDTKSSSVYVGELNPASIWKLTRFGMPTEAPEPTEAPTETEPAKPENILPKNLDTEKSKCIDQRTKHFRCYLIH